MCTRQKALAALGTGQQQHGLSHERFLEIMPAAYLARVGDGELRRHYWHLARLMRQPGELACHNVERDLESLRVQQLAGAPSYLDLIFHLPGPDAGSFLLVIVAPRGEPGLLITAAYREPEAAAGPGRAVPRIAELAPKLLDARGLPARELHVESCKQQQGTRLRLLCANSAWTTLVKNLLETLESHQRFPVYGEIWRLPGDDTCPPLRNVWVLELSFEPALEQNLLDSLEQDLRRYMQQSVRPRSLFDMVGPAMVGPSSSHTAGANRIGRIARQILIAAVAGGMLTRVRRLQVKLAGSFRDTGPGHGTPAALGGGLAGVAADDERLFTLGDPQLLRRQGLDLGDGRVAFDGFVAARAADDHRHASEGCSNIAEVLVECDAGDRHSIIGFSLGGGNVEVRYLDGRRLRHPVTGKQPMVLVRGSNNDGGLDLLLPEDAGAQGATVEALDHGLGGGHPPPGPGALPFNTFEELGQHLERSGVSLLELILQTEQALTGADAHAVQQHMGQLWRRMRDAVDRGLASRESSASGMIGGDAAAILSHGQTSPLLGNIYGKALAYATAVSELNACHGVIVSCPTAGSCGILPGVLAAYQEQQPGVTEQRLVQGLLVAGFCGMLLFDDVSTAGADHGCQAEIGAGAAMTAAALAHLEGAAPGAVIQAFTLALKNAMGLVCDPVAGLVEVPCVKRNGLYSSMAISAAAMALAGVRSFVSPDEVVLAVREVGQRLHRDYRETAGGGLARTRDGKRVAARLARQQGSIFQGDDGEGR